MPGWRGQSSRSNEAAGWLAGWLASERVIDRRVPRSDGGSSTAAYVSALDDQHEQRVCSTRRRCREQGQGEEDGSDDGATSWAGKERNEMAGQAYCKTDVSIKRSNGPQRRVRRARQVLQRGGRNSSRFRKVGEKRARPRLGAAFCPPVLFKHFYWQLYSRFQSVSSVGDYLNPRVYYTRPGET